MNHCVFGGNLVKEVAVKDAKGTPVGNFTLALNERYKDKDGQWKDKEPSFLEFEIWGERAKYLAEVTKKGTGLVVFCKAQQDKWEDNGQKRSKVKFRVEDFKVTTVPARSNTSHDEEAQPEEKETKKASPKKSAGDEEIPF